MPKQIKALLFDLGGVVIALNFDKAFGVWGDYANLEASTIKARWSQDDAYEQHERGEIGGAEYFSSLRKTLGTDLTDEQFVRGWNAIFLGEIVETVALISRLQDRIPLYAFSNTNETHRAEWAKHYRKTLEPFRKIFCSCEIGKRKPEADAFAFVAAEMACDFDEIVFFDDTETNVSAAEALGIRAVLVTSPDDVSGAVEAIL